MSIVVSDLTKKYKDQFALDAITFEARSGEITGLVGPNGAGKSTTMKILTCFMPATSGDAFVCDLDVKKDDLDLRKLIGYLPEHNPLYKNMYIKEYLNFVSKVHRLSNRKQAITQVIEKVGLQEEQHKKIGQLSKGYKQRVGLAQALIHDPKVLILDEPISGLDPNQLEEIRKLISKLKEDKTIIFSSHILQEIESICDKVVILDKGKIVADDALISLKQEKETLDVVVEFLNDISMDILSSRFKDTTFEYLASNKYVCKTNGNDIRADLFDFAVEKGNKLIGLHKKDSSLENVFKNVTNKGAK